MLTPEEGRLGQLTPGPESRSTSAGRRYRLDHESACGTKLSYRIARGHELHGRIAIIFQLRQLAENIRVIDFTRTRLVPAWHVRDVHQPNPINILLQLLDQVSFRNLRMVEVIQKFHVRMAHLANDLESFRHRGQVIP